MQVYCKHISSRLRPSNALANVISHKQINALQINAGVTKTQLFEIKCLHQSRLERMHWNYCEMCKYALISKHFHSFLLNIGLCTNNFASGSCWSEQLHSTVLFEIGKSFIVWFWSCLRLPQISEAVQVRGLYLSRGIDFSSKRRTKATTTRQLHLSLNVSHIHTITRNHTHTHTHTHTYITIALSHWRKN